MSTIACTVCSFENEPGSKFCNQCGSPLEIACPTCGTVNAPGSRFCNNCGTALTAGAPAPSTTAAVPPVPQATPSHAERRLVSVLFTDLVGFTTFSESRDPEEVRGFLTGYFDRSREIVERFGGTIEKFIGDAVMAVWGTVEARENDAERAVRAGLELIDMVAALATEEQVPGLEVRVGVLTGEAAVGPGGNESTGMIVGDLVNSASRLQSAADPGTVYVGEATHRITADSIQYEAVGTLDVKGKSEPIEAYRAVRVIAQRGGRGATDGLEPPFVGRDDEFRFLKDQIHATGRENGARLVSIVGDPGIGKTRITWELAKYIDGISEPIYWHHGRSPDYGESLTFWALGEMVRQRAGIAEVDDPAKSRMKLRTAVAAHATSEEDQRWIEPRLAGLLGLEEMPPGDRSEMFAAIRTFFQRIAELGTTVLVFEDLHWADDGLIDFITELVERSTRSPILVITLARPDLLRRYPGWGSGRRNTMSMQLAPLSADAMRDLVVGTIPGVGPDVVSTIATRAGGVPLYAVEFMRMLLSGGELRRTEDGRFEVVGQLDVLTVPETVQAVIGSRLDRLTPDARSLLQDASVLGQSFTPQALAGIRGEPTEEVVERLRPLVRDELLEFEEDPRSPERGQYRYVQGLIREVAYGRLAREDRVQRHVRAAEYFESLGDLELAAALATHYMAAYEASGSDTGLVERARSALVDAAGRAGELHAHRQALTLLGRALEITDDAVGQGSILERLADIHVSAGEPEEAIERAGDAIEKYRGAGDTDGEKRAATLMARSQNNIYRLSDAQATLQPYYDPQSEAVDPVTIELELELARAYMFADAAHSLEIAERALSRGSHVLGPATLVNGIINRANALGGVGRYLEARVLLRGTVHVADELGLTIQAVRAIWNLGVLYQPDDLQLAASMIEDVLARLERTGDQSWMLLATDAQAITAMQDGRFAEAEQIMAALTDPDLPESVRLQAAYTRALNALYQTPAPDDFARARAALEALYPDADMEKQRVLSSAEIDFLEGSFEKAATRFVPASESSALPIQSFLAAMWLRDEEGVKMRLDDLDTAPPGRYVDATRELLSGTLAAIAGDRDLAAEHFITGCEVFSRVAPAVEFAAARALFCHLVGADHPAAAEAAAAARGWLDEVGATQLAHVLADGLPGVTGVAAAAGA